MVHGLEFAPLIIPIHRRLETMTVALFFVSMLLPMFIVLPAFTYILLFTKYWYLPAIYFLWIYYDRQTPFSGGRKWREFRNFKIWSYYRNYFPIGLVKTADIPADKNYIFCVYPHGVASSSSFLNFMSNANNFEKLFPGIDPYLVTLNVNFKIPFSRDLFLAMGGISASESSMVNCLTCKPGNSCVLMPGGAGEALKALPGQYTIILKKRRGFVRVALKTGASLVPVFSFGENEVFDQLTGKTLFWIQDKLRKIWGLAPCVIKGRGFFQYTFGILPHRRPIVTVVGEPILVPKVELPTPELIDEYHQKFTNALVALFENHNEKYHPGKNVQLTIE